VFDPLLGDLWVGREAPVPPAAILDGDGTLVDTN